MKAFSWAWLVIFTLCITPLMSYSSAPLDNQHSERISDWDIKNENENQELVIECMEARKRSSLRDIRNSVYVCPDKIVVGQKFVVNYLYNSHFKSGNYNKSLSGKEIGENNKWKVKSSVFNREIYHNSYLPITLSKGFTKQESVSILKQAMNTDIMQPIRRVVNIIDGFSDILTLQEPGVYAGYIRRNGSEFLKYQLMVFEDEEKDDRKSLLSQERGIGFIRLQFLAGNYEKNKKYKRTISWSTLLSGTRNETVSDKERIEKYLLIDADILNKSGDTQTVELLITALKKNEKYVSDFVLSLDEDNYKGRLWTYKYRDKRLGIAKRLGMLGGHRAIGALIKLMNDDNDLLREEAVHSLGYCCESEIDKIIIRGLKDDSESVRVVAKDVMDICGGTLPDDKKMLYEDNEE